MLFLVDFKSSLSCSSSASKASRDASCDLRASLAWACGENSDLSPYMVISCWLGRVPNGLQACLTLPALMPASPVCDLPRTSISDAWALSPPENKVISPFPTNDEIEEFKSAIRSAQASHMAVMLIFSRSLTFTQRKKNLCQPKILARESSCEWL